MFDALDYAVSGATVARTWLDAISDNVANVNTVRGPDEEPFRARLVVARSLEDADGIGRGVTVDSIVSKPGPPDILYDPENPLADEEGYVTRPKVDMAEEMANLMSATRLYQANLAVVDRARDAYMSALRIGRS